jgi:cysteinyl-tRNA synthetase
MGLKLFNTMGRKKEEFKPIHAGKVNMFVCGPTVYDAPHLGHAKTYTQFDFIARYLKHKGFEVFYLQNITDIDDKIISRAKEAKTTPEKLARKFEDIYKEEMVALHNTSVNQYARATEHIKEIVNQVKTLMDKGFAYKIKDGIYYELKKFPDYGKLSGRKTLEENDAVSRIDENPEKKSKGDFCLWKFYKEGEPYWEDEQLPPGRPGWHIEDTAITEHYFGQQYDLHGGAIDLIFPHHEAEIAQQEAASGKKPFVRYWLHTGFLNINSEKMSKSKGNFFTLREALEKYDYKTLRFFFLSNHYRTTLDFTPQVLEQSKNGLQRLNDFVIKIKKDYDDEEYEKMIVGFSKKFYAYLDDDFDTPNALASLFDLVREVNIKGKPGKRVFALMKELDQLFDFMTFDEGTIDKEIEALVQKREDARKKKDFRLADKIRDEISSKGFVLEDTADGVRVKKK